MSADCNTIRHNFSAIIDRRSNPQHNGHGNDNGSRKPDRQSRQPRVQRHQSESQQKIQRENLALMGGVTQRDNEALKELFERYSRYVFGVCLRVLGDRGDAEEVMIDTFWELWRKPERYDPARGSLVKYLVMMARSRAIDRSRTRANSKKMLLSSVQLDDNVKISAARPMMNTQPLESMEHNEQRWKVARLLRELNEGQREAIELCFFHGLSHQQAAEVLEQPLGTVKTRIRQGLIRLRNSLRNRTVNTHHNNAA